MSMQSTPEDQSTRQDLPEPKEWLPRYGDVLYRYALSRLRRPEEAEEVVQETLLAALQSRAEFQGRAQPQTWLLGILKHKVIDRLRASARRGPNLDADSLDEIFTNQGKWKKAPPVLTDPADLAERKDFWEVVRNCVAKLPSGMAEAFTLRTLDDRDSEEVCRELAITPGNLWVLLHRARVRLVRCLQLHWFDNENKP